MEQLSASEIAQRPAPPNDPTGVLHRCEEMSDLAPVVQQVDIVEERHGGAAADPVVKVMVKEYDAADTPAIAGDAGTIPALEADFVPRDFTRLSAWDLDRNERVMSEFDGKVREGASCDYPPGPLLCRCACHSSSSSDAFASSSLLPVDG